MSGWVGCVEEEGVGVGIVEEEEGGGEEDEDEDEEEEEEEEEEVLVISIPLENLRRPRSDLIIIILYYCSVALGLVEGSVVS